MSRVEKRPLVSRIFKGMLGTDQPSYIAAVVAACLLVGHVVVFGAGGFLDRPNLPFWRVAVDALALSLFLMPFLMMGLARALRFVSPWEGLATLTAAALAPALFQRLVADGTATLVLRIVLPLAFIAAAFIAARWLERSLGRR